MNKTQKNPLIRYLKSMRSKKAVILGVTGQDGSYLTEILLAKGYVVYGMVRRTSRPNTTHLNHILYDEAYKDRFILKEGDMADQGSLMRLIREVQPDEVYNFAAMAGVGPSFYQPEYALDTGGIGVLRILEAIRLEKPDTKFFQAGSSHIFGDTPTTPQTETTPKQPISPYGVAKAMGQNLVHYYRQAYGMFCCSAIFYAHASPRYSEGFLLSKVIHTIWRIEQGLQKTLEVGDLNTPMDIGYAKEYMEAVYEIMHQDNPDDFIIATGTQHTAQEFLDEAFRVAGLDKAKHVIFNPAYKRPSEVSVLVGDYSKAKDAFGFEPKVTFKELIRLMYEKGNV